MGEEHDYERLEEQHDLFTAVATVFFICLLATLANGFFELLSRRDGAGDSTRALLVISLYVMPGLLSGFMWRKLGVPLGAAATVAVRLLSLINLAFIVPYGEEGWRSSFQAAVDEVPNLPMRLLFCAFAGAVCGLLGQVVGSRDPLLPRWSRWLRKMAIGLLSLGFLVAAGTWLRGFVPWKDAPKAFRQKMERLEGMSLQVEDAVAIIVWAGVVCLVLCLLHAAYRRITAREPEPDQDREPPVEQELDPDATTDSDAPV